MKKHAWLWWLLGALALWVAIDERRRQFFGAFLKKGDAKYLKAALVGNEKWDDDV